jgi:DNA-binding NtrC family response regulator
MQAIKFFSGYIALWQCIVKEAVSMKKRALDTPCERRLGIPPNNERVLEESGAQVATVSDGGDALSRLSRETPVLVISELALSGLSGVELMQEMKKRKVHVPIIYVTGHGECVSYLALMNMGAFDYFAKPVNEGEMLWVIRNVVEKTSENRVAFA